MLLERDPPQDFKALILDFRRWGWTMRGLANALNVPKSTLLGWCNEGKTPLYEEGRALVKLHALEAAKHERRNGDPVLV